MSFLPHSKLARFLAFLLLMLGASTAGAIEPDEIVAKADAVRVPKGSYEFEAAIVNYEGETKQSESGYKVYVRDLEHSLVEFRSPAAEKGKSLLMIQEDLWIYLPRVKKPVRIPLQQRLAGNVSNGDMARANFSNDYSATLAGEEKIGDREVYVLDLVAKSPSKTYNKIKYKVAKSDFHPVTAEYYTVSGASLKTCTFEDFRQEAGALRPVRLVFQDSLNPRKKSILTFSGMVTKQLDLSMFTKDYMKTLE
ncbi:MAG TPA: outer membrane lipoprotein-sorting protein [bacterium]|nr:outer membrane lipoprotein-sorting protein [bacterium]